MEQLIIPKYSGNARLVRPVRNQMQMSLVSLDQLVPEDHKVRLVWKYIEKLEKELITLEDIAQDGMKVRAHAGSASFRRKNKSLSQAKEDEIRVSKTDPEARKMKMANGGYNLAYNIQFATDVKTKIIVGLETTNQETDYGLMSPMQKQIINRYGIYPKRWLADGGYGQHEDIEEIAKLNPRCKIYVPPRHSENQKSYVPKEDEN